MTPDLSRSGNERYQRIDNFSEGTFEGELLIMHGETQDTVMLNSTAAAIWESLRWPQTIAELAGLLMEAFPDQPRDRILRQVGDVLEVLDSRGLIRRGNGS